MGSRRVGVWELGKGIKEGKEGGGKRRGIEDG